MAIIRVYAGKDGQSHFEEITPELERRGDKSASAELIPGSGILIRRFDADRSNPWHHAPGRYAVFTLSGAVDIEIGDGTVRRLGLRASGLTSSLGAPMPRLTVSTCVFGDDDRLTAPKYPGRYVCVTDRFPGTPEVEAGSSGIAGSRSTPHPR